MSDLVRNESYIGKKYNFVGTVQTDLILETIGKVYIKQQNKMTRLDQLVEQIINKHQAESPIIILGEDQSIPLATYPGEGVLIYDPINQVLYITYNDDYMMLVDTGGKEIYVKLNGDTMTGQLQIELEDTTLPPLVVNTNVLVENLNSQYLNGYSSDDFLRQDTTTATIQGDWTFNKIIKTSNGIQSSRFISGCNGSGFYINNNGDATVNNLTVRGTLSECNPSSTGEEYEEQPEYISYGADGEYVAGNWMFIPEDTEIEQITIKNDQSDANKLDYPIKNNDGEIETYSLYKYGIDDTNPNENTEVYIDLITSNYNVGTEDEDKLLTTTIATFFDGDYYKLTFPDDMPKHLSNTNFKIGQVYKFYKYSSLDKYSAEYYCFILLNSVTCADGTKAWIIKMSRRNLQCDWHVTEDCENNYSYSNFMLPYYILMTKEEDVDSLPEGTDPNPCIILQAPRAGDQLVPWGDLASNVLSTPNNTFIVMGSKGFNQGFLQTRIGPSFTSQTFMESYPRNFNSTGIAFSTGWVPHLNQEGDWYSKSHPNYATYNHYLISENTSIRTATDDINKTPPEGAQYKYTQQGYIIDDGMIKHFHRTQSNECMANRDGYLSNGIQLNKDGKLGYIGNLTEDSPYESNIVDYHNNLIINNEIVVNHTNQIASILEQLTQLNQNLTQINTKITELETRIDNIESGTSGDLTDLTTRVTNLEKNKLDASQISRTLNGSGSSSQPGVELEYTLKIGNTLVKFGRVESHDDGSRGTAEFYTPFPSSCVSVVISGIREGKGADGHNYVYNVRRTGFEYQVDNCEAYFVAIGY